MEEERTATLKRVFGFATLFSNCVETFGLIHPQQEWNRNEQILLVKLGIQQARLLVWGGLLGVTSPPASIATHMIPSNPSATNPEPEMAIFFGDRDARLDDADVGQKIHGALSEIIDQADYLTRKDMMSRYGLKPSKKGLGVAQPALDNNRLEGFREKYSLLHDLIEAHGIKEPKKHSVVAHSWLITDQGSFAGFIDLIRGKVDYLIEKMDLADRVNRAVKVDIRALGWHPSLDNRASALNISKMMIVHEACLYDYPEYALAAQQALDNVNDKWKGSGGYKELIRPVHTPIPLPAIQQPPTGTKAQRPGILRMFRPKSWRKPKPERRQSAAEIYDTPRSKSETISPEMSSSIWTPAEEEPVFERVRSKSVSDIPIHSINTRLSQDNPLSQVKTVDDDQAKNIAPTRTLTSMISRHDQWLDHYG